MSEYKHLYKNIREAYLKDQKERTRINWNNFEEIIKLFAEDLKRNVYAKYLLESELLKTKQDFFYAAMIFHHSNDVTDLSLAVSLSRTSMDLGSKDGKWLYARSLDRFLLKIGRLQKFGTQFDKINGKWVLCRHDKNTTDKERKLYDVPTLSYQKNIRSKELDKDR
jgi:hypothetical protein